MIAFEPRQVELHGRTTIYRIAGSGPHVVLVHGMLNSSRHWEAVAVQLAERYTVIAPDLIGHGDSQTPRGDYSIGAHAASIRDLLAAIGVNGRASFVGHSLGGGVAMQYFWQFPSRVDRLVLVSSGGLGPEVSPVLRTAALPGASGLLWLICHPRLVEGLMSSSRAPLKAIGRALRPLSGPGARESFLQTLRSVIDVHGQRVSARDRLHLLAGFPTLIVWGEQDHTIPLEHGRAAHEAIAGSGFETLPKAAHFPHLEDPAGLAAVLLEWLAATEPAALEDADWGGHVRGRQADRAWIPSS